MVKLIACLICLGRCLFIARRGAETADTVSDVFEVFTIESNDTGTDGTCGEGNQIDSRITIVTKSSA